MAVTITTSVRVPVTDRSITGLQSLLTAMLAAGVPASAVLDLPNELVAAVDGAGYARNVAETIRTPR